MIPVTVELPPSEDPAAWEVAAHNAGLELNPKPTWELVHDGSDWFLQAPGDSTQRYPIPPPTTPERRAAVMELAARLGPPTPSEVLPSAEPFREEHIEIPVTAAVSLPPSEAAELSAEPPAIALTPTVVPTPPEPCVVKKVRPPLTFPAGLMLGVEPTAVILASEPRPDLALSFGRRSKNRTWLGGVLEAGPAMPIAGTSATIERDSLRGQIGWAGVFAGVGLERVEIYNAGHVRGELLLPTVEFGGEVPIRVGTVWIEPRAAMHLDFADVEIELGDSTIIPGIFSMTVGVRAELALPGGT